MNPKAPMRQQNGNIPATSGRKQLGERVHIVASMPTEYQERFLPPRCHTTMVTSCPQKAPYHTLKGTNTDTAYAHCCWVPRRLYVTQKCLQHQPEAPKSSLPPKVNRRCSSAPNNPVRSVANQMASMAYTSVYKYDFQAWKANKRKPYKLVDSLQVNQGLVVNSSTSKANSKVVEKEMQEQLVHQTKALPLGKAKESFPPADKNHFLSTSHADYTAHKCLRTKPILPSVEHRERSKEPFETKTTMREAFKAWDTPRRSPCVPKEGLDWAKTATVSLCANQTYESCNTNQKPSSPNPEVSDTEGCKSTENTPSPAEDGGFARLDRTSPDMEESRTCQKSFTDRTVNWFDGGICEESPEEHPIFSCMVSTRS
ncbi:hypothetical protein PBY51_006078 [Eleginops maclovinus]|uniref:Uncharacterized protein n=1 Tax=Eleginops maclovinus TaxID=56733 RepID=A0AAN7WT56_ELEMC|nr:hypothetical protein PBY51_006078 [Eleginops maclovinus]